jgi:signal peptidase I
MPLTANDREDLKLGLAVEALRTCGTVCLKARGTSMLPSIWPGDVLTIGSVAGDQLAAGDIVWFMRYGRCFIHRLVTRDPVNNRNCFVTRGDAMPQNDPPVAAADLLGRVIRIRRGNRVFVPQPRVPLSDSAVAWVLFRSHRLRGVALRIHPFLQSLRQSVRVGPVSLRRWRRVPGTSAFRQL